MPLGHARLELPKGYSGGSRAHREFFWCAAENNVANLFDAAKVKIKRSGSTIVISLNRLFLHCLVVQSKPVTRSCLHCYVKRGVRPSARRSLRSAAAGVSEKNGAKPNASRVRQGTAVHCKDQGGLVSDARTLSCLGILSGPYQNPPNLGKCPFYVESARIS